MKEKLTRAIEKYIQVTDIEIWEGYAMVLTTSLYKTETYSKMTHIAQTYFNCQLFATMEENDFNTYRNTHNEALIFYFATQYILYGLANK